MTSNGQKYLLDANIFMTAHQRYYAFDLCPGFWESLKEGFAVGRIFSTQRVLSELTRKADVLSAWVLKELPSGFFLDDASSSVAAEFAPMMQWVTMRDFTPAAKNQFATAADGWLIAVAKQGGFCLVTHEERNDAAKANVKMPNVCLQFGVPYCNTFVMLRDLGCSYR